MSEKAHISLSQLGNLINSALNAPVLANRWVVAEIANINVNRTSGHCYIELVEKSPVTSQTIASIKATIWAAKYKLIASYFHIETGSEMAVGMKIMFCCTINYHPVYSLSINITDIDPTYTVGEAQKQRTLIIEALKKDGVFDMNKELQLPIVIQKIAVISSATAAGYEDFLHQLQTTEFKFEVTLFPAMMQGNETQESVCEALSKIANHESEFDAAVIIRGGGATTDLQWFDSYEICSYIAQMPIPCITGIGHQKDLSIADMVANRSLKTPTAVASFIIETTEDFYSLITTMYKEIIRNATKIIDYKNTAIANVSLKITAVAQESLNRQSGCLETKKNSLQTSITKLINKFQNKNNLLLERIENYSDSAINQQKNKLIHIKELLDANDPKNVLQRGFAIVKNNGKIISDPTKINIEDTITIEMKNSKITSKVTKIS